MKKIGIFSLTSCDGCQLQILNLGEKLLDMLSFMDIAYFRLAEENSKLGFFDIAFVEGGVSTRSEIKKIKNIRENSKYLVALGACAGYGGIPSLRNIIKHKRYDHCRISKLKAYGLDKYVKVDCYLNGCPINEDEFASLLINLIVDKIPQRINHAVCVECTEREIKCLMLEGKACLGPITAAGCEAICPLNSTPCEGCRGVIKDANIESLIELFEDLGISKKIIKDKLYRFAANIV
jgi:coenzyme F420-reducing hydrogenase gamma subunit